MMNDEVGPSPSWSIKLRHVDSEEWKLRSKLKDLANAAESDGELYACRKELIAHHRNAADWYQKEAEQVEEIFGRSLLPVEDA